MLINKFKKQKFLSRNFFISILVIFFSFSLKSCLLTSEKVFINKIIDGDTFENDENIKYRLLGVDTPESYDSFNHFKPTIGLQKFYAKKAHELSKKSIFQKYINIKI